MRRHSSKGSGGPGFVQLEPPCPKSSVLVRSADPEPLWTVGDLFSEIENIELLLGGSSLVPLPLKPPERVSSQGREMHIKDELKSEGGWGMSSPDTDVRDKSKSEGGWKMSRGFVSKCTRDKSRCDGGWKMSCFDIDSSDSEESDDDLPIGVTKSCIMDKEDIYKSILFELKIDNQRRFKEELRHKLTELEELQLNEVKRSASVISNVAKYMKQRQEMDREIDMDYRRKIAKVLDNHLLAIQKDHEQISQIEEQRIREDGVLEEAKKRAVLEEKLRQEKEQAEAEAKLRNAKMAVEAERAALEAAQRRVKESIEKEAARIAEVAASEEAKKKSVDHNNKEANERISVLEPKQVQLSNGIKVLAADGALNAEANRKTLYNEVSKTFNLISQKELDRCERQIIKNLKQITGSVEKVRAKAQALIKILNDPSCPSPISQILFAKMVVYLCEDPAGILDSIAFACGHVILLVTSQVPHLMDFVLAEFHNACIYTVPKHLQPSDQALQNREYWKMVGYHEEEGKMESSEDYLHRVYSYMTLYAAIVQTEQSGVRNPHGLGDGWTWLATFLNALPANRSTAYALEAFLRMAGFALHRRYKYQFRKLLNIISRRFLPALKEGGDKENDIIKKLERYLGNQMFLKEPEGWRLHSSVLSADIWETNKHLYIGE